MAFTPETLLGSLITAVLSGGGTAFTTVFALFKDIKKKVEELEKKVGSFESKTGLAYSIVRLEESLRDIKRDTEETTDARRRRPSFLSFDDMLEADATAVPSLIQRIRNFEVKLREIDETLQRLDMKVKRMVTEDEFETADRKRAEEIAGVRTTVFEVKGLLQGLHMALGLTKR
jgi:predicted RNase H-like nuclease (RuvC/YqgF family)